MVTINEQCIGCGLCVPVCPEHNISLVDGRALVEHDACLACCHCQAACPCDAISVTSTEALLGLQTMADKTAWLPFAASDPAELVQLMRSRRSCRNFQETGVSRSVLEDLVKIGTTAPSGTNSQAWTFHIAGNRQEVMALGEMTADFFRRLNQKAENPCLRIVMRLFAADVLGRYYRGHYRTILAGLQAWDERGEDRLFHGATAAILVGGKDTASCPGEDALLVSQNILLAAHAMGLGSCLIGFVVKAISHDVALQKKIGLTAGEKIYSVIALGYPAEKYYGLAGRRPIMPRYLQLAD